MSELLKNKAVLIAGICAALFFALSIKSCADSYRLKNSRDKEMALRLDLEEKLHKSSQAKTSVDEQVKKMAQEFTAAQAALQEARTALAQEQQINQSLKNELEKLTKLKDALENNLKEALAAAAAGSKPAILKK
jgi:septal ring factor EnvC (AmiA/AmiB activator)